MLQDLTSVLNQCGSVRDREGPGAVDSVVVVGTKVSGAGTGSGTGLFSPQNNDLQLSEEQG